MILYIGSINTADRLKTINNIFICHLRWEQAVSLLGRKHSFIIIQEKQGWNACPLLYARKSNCGRFDAQGMFIWGGATPGERLDKEEHHIRDKLIRGEAISIGDYKRAVESNVATTC